MSVSVRWAEVANALSEGLSPRLNPRAMGVLYGRCNEPIVIACSGGADSMALLLLVWALLPEARPSMTVAHFNHCLRGAEADADEVFVCAAARDLGICYSAGEWDTAPEKPSEAEARGARHAFLQRICAEVKSRTLLTGHHQDDVGETMLMRLCRGSGIEGLAAPRPVAQRRSGLTILRPLLDIPKADIVAQLDGGGATWREDCTNRGSDYLRNQVRNEIIPLLNGATGRNVAASAARSRALLEEVDELLNELAQPMVANAGALLLKPIRKSHPAVARRALEIWLSQQGVRASLSAAAFEKLLEDVRVGRCSATSAGSALLRFDAFELALEAEEQDPAPYDLNVTPGCRIFFPWGGELGFERVELGEEHREQILSGRALRDHNEAYVAIPAQCMLRVRSSAPGDAYKPLGAPGRMKLKEQLINRKIPVAERCRLPVVCYGDSIVWCAALPPAEKFKLEKQTHEAGWLTYRGA